MNITLTELAAQFETQNPPLTREELERQIACYLSDDLNDAVQEVATREDIITFTQLMQEKFGLSCEIAPALSLYVNLSSPSDEQQPSSIEEFSSLSFEKMLDAVLQKNKEATSPEEIVQLMQDAINAGCKHFLNAVVLCHPLLMKIFRRLQTEFNKTVTITTRTPVKVTTEIPKEIKSAPDASYGNYL